MAGVTEPWGGELDEQKGPWGGELDELRGENLTSSDIKKRRLFFHSPFLCYICNMESEKNRLKVTLVQPNKVTNARQEFDERQENILTLMIDAIQKHMTQEVPIETDLFGAPMVRVDVSDVNSSNKVRYLRSAIEMTRKSFEFEYTNVGGKKEDVYGVLVTTVRNVKDSPFIELTINQWAIPYLLYWGKGVGGTVFNKSIALILRGEYTKRLYKLCKRWEDKGGFTMSLDEFRLMMHLESKYESLKDLRRWVLEPSIQRMKEKADVYFKYSFEKIGGSRSFNQVNFVVYPNQKNIPTKEVKTEMYSLVYNVLAIAYPREKSSKAMNICDEISQDPEVFEKLYFRMKRFRELLGSGDKELGDVVRLIKYVMREDYGVK